MKDAATTQTMTEQIKAAEFLTVNAFCRRYPEWPSPSALRAIILDAPTNGFARAFVRVGRRVLIDVDEFWGIVQAKRGTASAQRR
jgi:hypothetical protein